MVTPAIDYFDDKWYKDTGSRLLMVYCIEGIQDLRVEDVAKMLGVSTRHVFRLVDQEKLKGKKTLVKVIVKPTYKEVLEIDPLSVEAYKFKQNKRPG